MFRPFYFVAAIAIVAVSFFDLFERVADGDFSRTYGSLYDMAGRPNGMPASIGLVLLYLLAATLVSLSVRGTRRGLGQVGVITISAIAVLLLLVKPGTSSPQPALAAGGWTLLVLAVLLGVAAAVDLRAIPQAPVQVPA